MTIILNRKIASVNDVIPVAEFYITFTATIAIQNIARSKRKKQTSPFVCVCIGYLSKEDQVL